MMTHPGGRPPKYHEGVPQLLLEAMDEGKSIVRFCREIKIARRTFYRWVEENPELSHAFEQGKDSCEGFWEEWLVNNLDNKDVNSGLVKLFMTNRFGWKTDKSESRQESNYSVVVSESDRIVRQAKDAYIDEQK